MLARDESLWIFGGFQGRAFTADVYRLDFTNEIRGAASGGMHNAVWQRVKPAGGFAPWPRALGCLLSLPSPASQLLLLGGGDGDADFDDAYAFDVTASTWQRLTNITGEPWALSNAACALLPGGSGVEEGKGDAGTFSVIMQGGFGGPSSNRSAHKKQGVARVMALAGDGWRWSELKTSGSKVSPRMSHRIAARNSSFIVMFGGNGDGQHLGDLVFGRPNRAGRGSPPSPSESVADSSSGECTQHTANPASQPNDDDDDEVVLRTVRVTPK